MTVGLYLSIDTATAAAVTVRCGRATLHRAVSREQLSSRALLPLIKRCLKKSNTTFRSLNGIAVVSGPGPFTSLRVGVATANTLGYALNIPVVGIRATSSSDFGSFVATAESKLRTTRRFVPVKPYYGRAPHITKKKK